MSRLVLRSIAVLALALGCRGSSPAASHEHAPSVFDPSTTQLVTAIVDRWSSTHATLRLWSGRVGKWEPIGESWPGVVGGTGVAWGDPEGRPGPIKREGDGKSPAGVFALRAVYGYATTPPAGTKLPYTPVDAAWHCVDDPRSTHYARILDARTVTPDWKSAEDMRRTDELYTWVVDTAYNSLRVPSAGSCIFLHVWSGPASTTVGCTAMAEPQLAHLISVLDPNASPLYVLLPRAEYDALAGPWGLPAQ